MDPSLNSISLNGESSLLWEIGDDHKPTDSAEFLSFMDRIQEQNWSEVESKDAGKLIAHLDHTNLEDFENTDTIRKVKESLKENFPNLFFSVKIGNRKVKISKERLGELSPKFKEVLSSGFRESEKNRIDIKFPEFELDDSIKEDVVVNFIQYLETGEIHLNGENVLPLLYMADEHDLPGLLSEAESFLSKNIEMDSLAELLHTAGELNLENLKWACLQFVHANNANDALQTLLTSNQISDSAKNVIQFGLESSKRNISFSFSKGVGHLNLSNRTIDDKYYVLLSLINEDMPIRSLRLEANMPEDQIERLSNSLPVLHQLVIRNNIITSIPDKWLSNLKKLDCSLCDALTTVTAPKAEKLYCRRCSALISVTAPKAEKLDCNRCPALTIVTAPEVKELDCTRCRVLTTVIAPKAKELNCWECDALQNPGVPDDCEILR